MAHRCEDFPCCGHDDAPRCPDFDESGQQLNMICVCGAVVPLGGPSCCASCLRDPDGYDQDRFDDFDEAPNCDFYVDEDEVFYIEDPFEDC